MFYVLSSVSHVGNITVDGFKSPHKRIQLSNDSMNSNKDPTKAWIIDQGTTVVIRFHFIAGNNVSPNLISNNAAQRWPVNKRNPPIHRLYSNYQAEEVFFLRSIPASLSSSGVPNPGHKQSRASASRKTSVDPKDMLYPTNNSGLPETPLLVCAAQLEAPKTSQLLPACVLSFPSSAVIENASMRNVPPTASLNTGRQISTFIATSYDIITIFLLLPRVRTLFF